MTTQQTERGGSMYLVLPVPFRDVDGTLHVEAQAANGLAQWADNFEQVTVAAPVLTGGSADSLSGFVWVPVSEVRNRTRIACQPLPAAYSPLAFFKKLPHVRRQMAVSIREHTHLQFAIGGLTGDWAAVAALEAIRQKRRFAIHTDRVEHAVLRKLMPELSGLRRFKATVEIPMMERYHRHVIRHASLGLWHGDDCFRAYSPWCRQNHLIHDVHTKAGDAIGEDRLEKKIRAVRESTTLKICYAGRMDPMKAPLEWVAAIAAAVEAGADVEAVWLGEGPLREQMLTEITRLHQQKRIRLGGFIRDRAELLRQVSEAHLFVFTHVTPESPRNLLEALVCGTPIVGYDNAYQADLLQGHGGGVLVSMHDVQALGNAIAVLARDRARVADLVRQAARNGTRFNDTAVFKERSRLIQQYA